jgi:hypothetical protein
MLVIFTGLFSCRERFSPNVPSLEQSFLVVEGNLNAGRDSTVIRLTRTYKLDANASIKTEDKATVTVEGSDNTVRGLTWRGNGYYTSLDLNMVINTNYRLRIKTTTGKEYVSDFVKARETPLIDSISWEREEKGVRIFANTKDLTNNSRYYRWDFDETWEIRSFYHSFYIYQGNGVRRRVLPAEDVFFCWKYDISRSIPLANSTRLQNDVIYKAPIMFIPNKDERLSVRYSIFVRQYALDKEAYNFYELMKKNTEEIGSIFTPQPSEIRGNLDCVTDPSEYVLGYVTASTVKTQRIFIKVDSWQFPQNCPDFRVPDRPDSIAFYFASGALIPYDFFTDPDFHYKGSYPECCDCTRRGGSLIKPSYW